MAARFHALPGRALARCAVSIAMLAGIAQAADIPGSKDPPFLKRYAGSSIVYYQTRSYERYMKAAADPNDRNSWKWSPIEGQVTRIVYQEPAGHSVLELVRNYQSALAEAGFTESFGFPNGTGDVNFAWNFWAQSGSFSQQPVYGFLRADAYLSANRVKDGQDITLALYFAQYSKARTVEVFKPQEYPAEQVMVVLDVITAKAVDIRMVQVKAADMADALATKGVVSLYGIYFDTDKSDVKAESKPTLDEVATLLKIDRSLKIEISGHTDSTGDKAHNAKLSEARAQAVMKALVTGYGIDPARLTAKGFGDAKPVAPNTSEESRAKNRRVELRKT
jgi:outer membrane protein OmpA-like peptidoglycan-associated protein